MARKQKFDYFKAFEQIAEYAVEYSGQLVKYLEKNLEIAKEGREPDVEYARKRFEELHEIETASDGVKHEIINHLATEFIAPLEREDIMALADELDDLVDDLDEILQRMYMYDVHTVNQSTVDMMHIAHKACIAVAKVCAEFHNFKKSDKIRPFVIEVNDCEEEGDKIYINAMHDIFANAHANQDVDALGQSRILTELERICDACEGVTDTIMLVVMKNS